MTYYDEVQNEQFDPLGTNLPQEVYKRSLTNNLAERRANNKRPLLLLIALYVAIMSAIAAIIYINI
jgi:hypothetical protein